MDVGALLHLASMDVLVSAAYIGIDRIEHEPDRFRSKLKETISDVQKLLLQLDVKQQGKLVLKDTYDGYPMRLLCHVAEEKISLGVSGRAFFFFRKLQHAPMLAYFKNGIDLAAVTFINFISTILFLVVSAICIWNFRYGSFFVTGSFIFLSASLVWIFFTAAVSYRLHNLHSLCQSYIVNVEAQVIRIRDESFGEALKFTRDKTDPE